MELIKENLMLWNPCEFQDKKDMTTDQTSNAVTDSLMMQGQNVEDTF